MSKFDTGHKTRDECPQCNESTVHVDDGQTVECMACGFVHGGSDE